MKHIYYTKKYFTYELLDNDDGERIHEQAYF